MRLPLAAVARANTTRACGVSRSMLAAVARAAGAGAVAGAGAALVLACALPTAAAGESWVKSRYEIENEGPVPAARYTLIQRAPVAPPSPLRALFTDAGGRRLVVTASTVREDGGPVRRATFELVGALDAVAARSGAADTSKPGPAAGPRISLRFAREQVEISGPGGLLAAYRRGEETRPELRPAFDQVRDAAGPDLLATLASYVRVGLAREPAFRVDAVLLADALFHDLPELPLQQDRRLNRGRIEHFDPLEHRPAPEEEPFGSAYEIPAARS